MKLSREHWRRNPINILILLSFLTSRGADEALSRDKCAGRRVALLRLVELSRKSEQQGP